MKTLDVIQFVRPNAEKRHLTLDVCDEAGKKWEQIEALGLRLTAEVIPLGSLEPDGDRTEEEQVCVSIENIDWGDYRMILCPNLPGGPMAREVEQMILAFDQLDYDLWLHELVEDEED